MNQDKKESCIEALTTLAEFFRSYETGLSDVSVFCIIREGSFCKIAKFGDTTPLEDASMYLDLAGSIIGDVLKEPKDD